MKTRTILFFIALLLSQTLKTSAQKKTDIEVDAIQIVKEDNKIHIDFKVEIGKKATSPNYKLLLVPTLFKKNRSLPLKPIVVETRKTKLIDARNREFQIPDAYYTQNGQYLDYSTTIFYEEWMNGMDVRLKYFSIGCCNYNELAPLTLADNVIVQKDIIPFYETQILIEPNFEPVSRKWNYSSNELIIDFKQNRIEIDFSLFRNREILAEIVASIDSIQKSPRTQLDKIEIAGYASPEGTIARNIELGIRRANALKNYIQQQFSNIKDSSFIINNGKVNWSGLRRMIVDSNMEYKQEVLHIIDNVPEEINYKTNTSRKKQLMDLAGGRPFNYMYENFFPKLRNACYISVFYKITEDTAADAINQAIPLLNEKAYEEALSLLLPQKDDSRSWNLIGVCYMMIQKNKEALFYFGKAIQEGNTNAIKNIQYIRHD